MFRTMFSRQQRSPNPPPAPLIPGAFPVLPTDTLLEKHSHRLNQIDELVGVSGLHFDSYYRPAIHAYARFVQQLPALAPEHESNPRSLLGQTLGVVCSALKIRRSYLLPAGASSEAIAVRKDLWTYATFAAALCHNLAESVTGQIITVYDSNGVGAEWEPWTGYIDEQGSWYTTDSVCDSRRSQRANANLLLVHRILPGAAMKWLASDPAAFSQWLACLSGDLDDAGGIGKIITTARAPAVCRCSTTRAGTEESAIRVILPNKASGPEGNKNAQRKAGSATTAKESSTFEKPTKAHDWSSSGHRVSIAAEEGGGGSHRDAKADRSVHDRQNRPDMKRARSTRQETLKKDGVDFAGQFLAWLRAGIRNKSIKVNDAKARIHVVEEGVLLATPGIFKAYAEAKGDDTDWLKIQKRFLKQGLHEKESGGMNVHKYSLKNNNKASTINGILLKDASVVFGLGDIPNPNIDLTKTQANTGSPV